MYDTRIHGLPRYLSLRMDKIGYLVDAVRHLKIGGRICSIEQVIPVFRPDGWRQIPDMLIMFES